MKLDPCLPPLTKIKWKWIKDLNVRPKPIKIPEENIGEMLFDIVLGNDFFFFDRTPKAQSVATKINT